jgi:rod shape determining protein RodA
LRQQKNIYKDIDWIILLIYVLLVFIGWISIYSAVYSEESKDILDFSSDSGKQLIWIGISFLIGFFILIIDAKFFSTFSFLIYGVTLLLLIAVLFMGSEINGSRSWFVISDSIKFQPSEIAKFATSLVIAKYLSTLNIKMEDAKTRLTAGILIGAPVVLILMQNETGSVLVFFSLIFVLYREGLSGNFLIVSFLMIVLFLLTLLINKFVIIGSLTIISLFFFLVIKRNKKNILTIVSILIVLSGFVMSVDYSYQNLLSEHQRKRIDVLLGKISDNKGAGYNVNQSMIAIGSGGFSGKGFLNGTQTKYKFVPEQRTDFIFCTIGEEYGFLGSVLVITLFVLLLLRLIFIAERQRSSFSRVYGYCVASILFFHVIINIGMTIGLAPVVGIPLPFISYGGSSLLAFTILLFVFIKQDANRLMIL